LIVALEFTGGVPYDILKPVVDRATPQQLFVLEHFNPYLMEDTDHLWQKACEKHFRNKQRQEMETWREMYLVHTFIYNQLMDIDILISCFFLNNIILCFGRHIKPFVPAAFAVVSTHQSALGPFGGLCYSFSLCVIHNEGLCPSRGH
jgi:hypothetical protein